MKLEEINVNIVKETSTGVNLYDSDQADRVILSSEFVDKYKKNKPDEFKTKLDPRMYFLRFNQKNATFKNQKFVKRLIWHMIKKELQMLF